MNKNITLDMSWGNSLGSPVIRTQYFHSLGQVQSLVGEPNKLHGKVKKKKNKKS